MRPSPDGQNSNRTSQDFDRKKNEDTCVKPRSPTTGHHENTIRRRMQEVFIEIGTDSRKKDFLQRSSIVFGELG
jgi:hypothetical protein